MTRRDELAAFLRARRDALAPTEVGLPEGRSRRTKGLRREEIAMLAGVSVTWYTWLEQGRPINASVDVLSALARFNIRYRSSTGLDEVLDGTYAGPLGQVVGRLLNGYDYAAKRDGLKLEVTVFGKRPAVSLWGCAEAERAASDCRSSLPLRLSGNESSTRKLDGTM